MKKSDQGNVKMIKTQETAIRKTPKQWHSP